MCQKVSSQSLPTPVNPTKLHNYLLGYDANKLQYLIEGFQQGFHLGYTGPHYQQYPRITKVQSFLHQS